jgi:hypothetical protein
VNSRVVWKRSWSPSLSRSAPTAAHPHPLRRRRKLAVPLVHEQVVALGPTLGDECRPAADVRREVDVRDEHVEPTVTREIPDLGGHRVPVGLVGQDRPRERPISVVPVHHVVVEVVGDVDVRPPVGVEVDHARGEAPRRAADARVVGRLLEGATGSAEQPVGVAVVPCVGHAGIVASLREPVGPVAVLDDEEVQAAVAVVVTGGRADRL